MAEIEIYTTPYCPYCLNAKRLLHGKGVGFHEIDVSRSSQLRQAMVERADGRHTVPQIFIDGKGVGGFDDISELDERGELDRLLGIAR